LQEYIKLGQRIKAFNIEAEIDGEWKQIDSQTTIGYKRILRFETITTSNFRINFTDAKACPVISNIELYHAPKFLTEPVLNRTKDGLLSMKVAEKGIEIYYTLDGSLPTPSAKKYIKPFLLNEPTTVMAMAYDVDTKKQTQIVTKRFDISKKDWKVIKITSGDILRSNRMIDDNIKTFWSTDKDSKAKQEVLIDLGKAYHLKGFTYIPMQERNIRGVITHYEFYVSMHNRKWKKVSTGEFGNIWNNPIDQKVEFNPTKARYIKLKTVKIHGGGNVASFAEIGVITGK
ncbi:MAG: discoidin domain-containing protein, partial [Bacteroidales bacterium]|nr:discoidin domain-containing protein [Bacteroidales bacterium]